MRREVQKRRSREWAHECPDSDTSTGFWAARLYDELGNVVYSDQIMMFRWFACDMNTSALPIKTRQILQT
jgi:hypothetical protein